MVHDSRPTNQMRSKQLHLANPIQKRRIQFFRLRKNARHRQTALFGKTTNPTQSKRSGRLLRSDTFHAFASYYFENYRKRKVAAETYQNDFYRYKKYLQPFFKETPFVKITLAQCQRLINTVVEQGKGKTADELHSIMNGIFEYAKNNHIIQHNPNDAVFLPKYQSENGVALTKAEEKQFLAKLKGSKFETCFAIALYTGIRPNEYTSVEIDENRQFIIAKNSKLKNKRNGEIVYKKIPHFPNVAPLHRRKPKPQTVYGKIFTQIL